TLFNALYAAGGVNEIGSLRGIKVYRNSKEVAKLDVYDYLLNGKYNTNIRLEENDMVIVSPYDQLAVVQGKVKRNRIFEMKKGETLSQLLNMAGG
ncbi:SLBB domain-containing protein, partial [Parabacteroides goldsteinii]